MSTEQNPLKIIEAKICELIAQRNKIDQTIATLQGAAKALIPIYGGEAEPAVELDISRLGLTTAIRETLRANADRRFTAVELRDALLEQGFPVSGYSNAMATVHQVIRRLIEARQVAIIEGAGDGKNTFQWTEESAARVMQAPSIGQYGSKHPGNPPASADPMTTPGNRRYRDLASKILPPPGFKDKK